MSDPAPLPVLRLKPKSDARRIRHGHPWAWADELVLDRRSRAVPAGAVALLEDAGRAPLGVGIASTGSKIGFRLLDPDPTARIDADWLRAKIAAALALRERLYAQPYYRLIHAEGDGLPGLIVDRFGDLLVIQPNLTWLEARLELLRDLLQELTDSDTIIMNGSSRVREAEGLPGGISVLYGKAPDGPVPVKMNNATYLADVMGGQKTGLFYDQRENHAFACRAARGGSVLDVFAHVGGFGLAGLAGGAEAVLAVDASKAALTLAHGGAEAMGQAARFETHTGDAFEVMETLGQEGRQFDLVIADPPAFAPSKTALTQGLRAYERVARLAAPLVTPGGILILCSCSHAADLTRFRNACLRGMGRAGRVARLIHTGFAGPDHPAHPSLTDTGYLKALGVPADMIACLDACVLYPTVLREVLLAVARAGLFRPVWSSRIEEEWLRAAARQGPADAAIARGEAAVLRRDWPDVLVAGGDEADLWLPDPADIHVLATARQAGAQSIVTLNLKDFPRRELAAFDLRADHPDAFLFALWQASPDAVSTAVKQVHGQAEAISGQQVDLRGLMKRARLPRLGKAIAS